MTRIEENQLTMYKAVDNFLHTQTDKLTSIPVMSTLTQHLSDNITEIEKIHSAHQSVARGKASEKLFVEDALVEQLVAAASGLYVYAVEKGNMNVRDVVKVTPSQLKRMRDTELLVKAQTIGGYLDQFANELGDYGVTSAMIESLKQATAAFDEALGATESSAATKTTQRSRLSAAFDKNDDLLQHRLDPMMEVFRTSDRDLYNEYVNVRVIRDL